jgi:hypothetical protein
MFLLVLALMTWTATLGLAKWTHDHVPVTPPRWYPYFILVGVAITIPASAIRFGIGSRWILDLLLVTQNLIALPTVIVYESAMRQYGMQRLYYAWLMTVIAMLAVGMIKLHTYGWF